MGDIVWFEMSGGQTAVTSALGGCREEHAGAEGVARDRDPVMDSQRGNQQPFISTGNENSS
jgi:hypothetical protein